MSDSNEKIIVRFAPSPTGFFHVGSLRTALFNYLFAKQQRGTYILRIEDTDKERSKKEYEDDILACLKWLGITHDAFYRQSEHAEEHKRLLKKLVDEGKAYVSKESEVAQETISTKADMTNRRESVIRFKNPNKVVIWNDMILGPISVDTTDLGDFVIAKDFDTPLYNFAVVSDDTAMDVTHVIRGQDHISNTPRQVLIYEALGAQVPAFGHIPLILAEDKAKLSKRKHGLSVAVRTYQDEGYLPEALLNFMALVGWNPGTEEEIFTLKELIDRFSIARVQKSSGVFNMTKLRWVNKEHIKKMSLDEQCAKITEFLDENTKQLADREHAIFDRIVPHILERIEIFSDVTKLCEQGELAFYFQAPTYLAEKLSFKGTVLSEEIKTHLIRIKEILENLSELECMDIEMLKKAISAYTDTLPSRGNALHPFRMSLSGRDKSPDPFTITSVIGKTEVQERLQRAIDML